MTRRAYMGLVLAAHGCRTHERASSTLRVAAILGSPSPFVMQSLGMFENEGVRVRIEQVASTGKIVQALIGGSADIASSALDQVIHLTTQAKRITMFFVTNPLLGARFYAASGAKRSVHSVADLKGGKIGIASFGSSIDFLVAALLYRHGMTLKDVERIATGSVPSAFAALESGKVDAAGLSMQLGLTYERRHPEAAILMDLATPQGARRTLGVDAYPMGLIADPGWLDRNRDAALRVARAYKAYHRWIAEHTPEEIRKATPAEHRSAQTATDLDYWTMTKGNICLDGRMPVNAPEQVRDVLAATLPTVHNVDVSKTWTDEFVDELR